MTNQPSTKKTEIFKNDEIVTKYGNVYKVESVYDNMVFVYDFQQAVHVSNIIAVLHSGTNH